MRSFDEIVTVVRHRMAERTPLLRSMEEIRLRYNAEWVIPMPDVDGEPVMPQVSPLLVANAIDGTAMRAASVQPWFDTPAVQPGKQTGKESRQYADIRRRAIAATLHKSSFKLLRRRYYRHLSGYATTALVVLPGTKDRYRGDGVPIVEVRNPLATYPTPSRPEETCPPEDCAFVYEMTAGQITRRWPETNAALGGPIRTDIDALAFDEPWMVFEWHDCDQICWGLLGPRWQGQYETRSLNRQQFPANAAVRLGPAMVNRAGQCCVICPERITLDRVSSQIANVVGVADLMDRLMRLDVIAQERAIFPDRYIIGTPGGAPRVVGGSWRDGREGATNIVEDVAQIGELRSTPDLRTSQMIDRLERNYNVSVGNPSPMQGETSGYAMRTGRGIDTLLGASIDPRVQELHEITEGFMPYLFGCIQATYEGWTPNKRFVMFSGWAGDNGSVEFVPKVHLAESHDWSCAYAIAGADVQLTTVALGQLRSLKGISLHTFRKRHPWIDDPDGEADRVEEEELEDAMRAGVQRLVSTGEMPPIYAARIEKHVRAGMDIFEAIAAADADARKEQATQAPPPPDGMVSAPQTMPGLAGPPQMQPPPGPPPEAGGGAPANPEQMRAIMAAMQQAPPPPQGAPQPQPA